MALCLKRADSNVSFVIWSLIVWLHGFFYPNVVDFTHYRTTNIKPWRKHTGSTLKIWRSSARSIKSWKWHWLLCRRSIISWRLPTKLSLREYNFWHHDLRWLYNFCNNICETFQNRSQYRTPPSQITSSQGQDNRQRGQKNHDGGKRTEDGFRVPTSTRVPRSAGYYTASSLSSNASSFRMKTPNSNFSHY